jgi:hypothetical protein
MHRSLVLGGIVTSAVLAGCGAAAATTAAAPSSTAAINDVITMGDYCTAGHDLAPALTAIANSTDTTSESVAKLNTIQAELGTAAKDAREGEPGDTSFATELTDLTTEVGHLKVALNENDAVAVNAAATGIGAAVALLPAC